MLRTLPYFWLGLSLTILASCMESAGAQELPSSPVPVVPPSPAGETQQRLLGQVQTPPNGVPLGPTPVLPPPVIIPPMHAPYQDENGPLLIGDPLIDRPHSPPPGWFSALELDLLAAHVKNRLQGTLQVDGFDPNLVHLPTAQLEWTGSPRIDLGYRLDEGWGEFLVSYRLLVTNGSATLPGFDLDGSDGVLKSRLSMNVFDFDYASREYSLDPHWDMKWRVGARLATIFFDSRAEAFFLEQKTSNHFIGAGPHAGLDLWRSFNCPGLGLFARVDGAMVVGTVSQGFEETVSDDAGNLTGTAVHVSSTQGIPVLDLQLGLGWVSCWHHHWSRLAIGYEFERWWNIGNAGESHAEVTDQGVFFRAEFGF